MQLRRLRAPVLAVVFFLSLQGLHSLRVSNYVADGAGGHGLEHVDASHCLRGGGCERAGGDGGPVGRLPGPHKLSVWIPEAVWRAAAAPGTAAADGVVRPEPASPGPASAASAEDAEAQEHESRTAQRRQLEVYPALQPETEP